MIRIISGKYKGRVIPTIKNADYRPSTSKFREALFSILTSAKFAEEDVIPNANILDLYAGTGSLSFEALSRGAQKVTLVDVNEEYLKEAKNFAEKIGADKDISCLKVSAFNLPYSGKKYNLVLMDPPYNKQLVSKTIKSLLKSEWLENGAYICLETSKYEDVDDIKNIIPINERRYGNSKLMIFRYEES